MSVSPSPSLLLNDDDEDVEMENLGPELPRNNPLHDSAGRRANEQHLRQPIFTESFPSPFAGAPLPNNPAPSDFGAYADAIHATRKNPYAPFKNRIDWEFARWIIKTIGHNDTQKLLKLGIVSIVFFVLKTN